jgi:hypothetical protein
VTFSPCAVQISRRRRLAGDIGQSDEHFEWLGTGFYLWQDSPWRAQAWAVDRFGDDAAVVAARVPWTAASIF